MCTGIELALIASIGAAAGGSVMQSNAQNKAQKASADAQIAELNRQKGLRAEAERIFAVSANKQQQSSQAVDESLARQKRENAYASVVSKPESVGYAPATGTGAPEVIQSEFKRAGAGAARTGMAQAKSRAALDAFGDNQLINQIFMGRQGDRLRRVGDFSRGSQGVLGSELTAAGAKGTSQLGDLLVALGKAGISATAGGALGGASGAPTNIVPTAMGPPIPHPVGVPFTPSYFAPSNFPVLY